MYLGFMLWIIGWPLYHQALVSLPVGLPGLMAILGWRQNEERERLDRYGREYQDYRDRTFQIWCPKKCLAFDFLNLGQRFLWWGDEDEHHCPQP
jgi:hypothetical protein